MKRFENYLILFSTSLFCLFFAEFGLRAFETQRHSIYPRGLFIKDKKYGHSLANNIEGKHVFQDYSYKVKTNNIGCFETQTPPLQPPEFLLFKKI